MKKTNKLLIVLCFWLIGFTLLAKPPLKSDQQPNRPKLSLKENRQRTQAPKAIGVILTFHKWPSEKEQQKISKILNRNGLTLSKKFESFKALVFSWPKLKTKNKAQKVCRKLSKLKNLNYCEPDALLRPNAPAGSDSKTEAGSPVTVCTADCDNQQVSTQNLLSDIQSMPKTTVICELAESKHKLKDGKLTDYWAQEMVGADLLKEELEKASPLPEDKHLVAVFDSPEDNHNIYVQNIISHEGPQAVLPTLNSSQLKYFQTSLSSEYMDAAEALSSPKENTVNEIQNMESTIEKLSSGTLPSFINNSMRWSSSEKIYEAMSRISPPSILVHSAGNDYLEGSPSIDPRASEFSKNFDSIIVGSLSPKGVASEYSQEGEEVHILAPSDYYITSVDENGNYHKFSGTSGATPLVTGSLAGFEWLSGYHPTAKEAKLLLEKTAVPTIHSVFENPKKNGKGMLNAYKLGKVAQRLKDKCKTDHQCFTQEIKNPENYQFSAAPSVLDNVQNAFPQCSGSVEDVKAVDCTLKKSAFKKLRQAVLLDTTNVELWKQLQCIYNQEGFSENALGVETTLWALSENLPDSDAINDPSFRRIIEESIMGVSRIGSWGLEILQKLSQDTDTTVRGNIAYAAGVIGGDGGLQILQTLVTDEDAMVRGNVAYAAGVIGGDGGLQILQTLVTDQDAMVRGNVTFAVRKIGGSGGLQILQTLVTDEDAMVRGNVVFAVGEIGGSGGLQILQTLVTDEDVTVRVNVAYAAGVIGGDGGLELLQKLAQDTDINVRVDVALAALNMGGDEGKELLQILVTDTDTTVRNNVAFAAGGIGGPGGLPVLKQLAQDTDINVRVNVALAALNMGGDEGKEILQILVTDTDPTVRGYVAWSAGKIGPVGLPVLQKLSQDTDKEVRSSVAEAAGVIGGSGGLQILQTLAQDTDAEVKIGVIRAVLERGEPGGLPILQPLVTDKDAKVRRAVVVVAARMGGDEGKELLKILAKDSNEKIRELAIRLQESL